MITWRRDSRQRSRPQVGANRHVIHALILLLLPGIAPMLWAQEKTAGETAGPPKRLSVAVLWLEDRTADPDLAHWRYAGSLLKSSLGKVKAIRTLSTGAVDYAYRQAHLKASDPIDPNVARRMGEQIEAQRVVWGNYSKKNSQWHVEVRVIHVAAGDVSLVLAAAANDWFSIRDEICEQVLRVLRVTPTMEETGKMAKRWTRSPEALDWCFRTYLSQEQGKPVSEQEGLCRKTLAADPNCAEAYGALAATLGTQGKFDLAEDALLRAIQLDPNGASAHATLGWIFGMQRQWDRAQTEFRQACRLDPDDADSLTWFAVACGNSGKRDEAAGLLEMAVSLDRTNALAHAHLASAYAGRSQKEQARRELADARHYLAEGISAGNALIIMGDTYGLLGERSEAIDCYERTVVLAKERAVNPNTLRLLEQRIQRIKSTLAPTFIEARLPQRYTAEALDALLRERLSERERELAPNPFSCTEPMRAWAQDLTKGAATDLDKAKAIFDGLAARPNSGGQARSRIAREVFEAWKQADTRLVCMDHAVLFVALARAVDVNTFFVNVTTLPDGTVVNHACAAVFAGQRVVLADPTLRWFGAPHQQYEILDDLQTAAFLCFNNREGDPRDLAACRAGLKLWPDSLQGQLCLVSALRSTDHLEEANQVLAGISEPQVKDYRAATYWGLRGLAAADEHDWKTAEAHMLKAVSLHPESASLHFNLGKLYWEQHRPVEARTALRACLRNDPRPMTAGAARHYIAQINEEIGSDSRPGATVPEPKPQ